MRCKHCGEHIRKSPGGFFHHTKGILTSGTALCSSKDAIFHYPLKEEEIIDLLLEKYS